MERVLEAILRWWKMLGRSPSICSTNRLSLRMSKAPQILVAVQSFQVAEDHRKMQL